MTHCIMQKKMFVHNTQPRRTYMNDSGATPLDLEARSHSEHAMALRLWLRLLSCSSMVERDVRSKLREEFATTLPRFDLMAQLERNPQGLKMKDLSQRLMVTGGNITTITDQLVTEGLVAREANAHDRRVIHIHLTAKGRKLFAKMATAHEKWIVEAFDGLTDAQHAQLYKLLGTLKASQLRA
jgi:DNA-binding MarR family transcriptional regulator